MDYFSTKILRNANNICVVLEEVTSNHGEATISANVLDAGHKQIATINVFTTNLRNLGSGNL